MARLEVLALSRSYADEAVALREASFTVEDGRIAAILGPSGCGKTTTLRLIAGLDRPDGGDVRLDGVSILHRPPHRRGVGLMFQDLALFPHMDVTRNVDFGLRMEGWPPERREERVAELLSLVGLGDKARRRVHELSGGERQRVALARTLAPQPDVLLLDEPLGALDEERKVSLRAELREVLTRLRTTALIVSHDLRDAISIADDLVVMEAGHVLQAGPLAEVLARPASVAVAGMVGYVVLAHGPVRDGAVVEPGAGAVTLPADQAEVTGGRAAVLAHPTTLLAVPADSGLGSGVTGRVRRARPDGPTQVLAIEIAGRLLEARWEWDLVPPDPGTEVGIAVRPGTLRVFPEVLPVRPDAGTPPLSIERPSDGPGANGKAPHLPGAGLGPHVPPPVVGGVPASITEPSRHPEMPDFQ